MNYHPPRSYVVRTRKGYDARCYVTRSDDHLAFGRILAESSHRTLAAANKAAAQFHAHFGGTLEVRKEEA